MAINGGSMGRRSPKTMLHQGLISGATWLPFAQQKRRYYINIS